MHLSIFNFFGPMDPPDGGGGRTVSGPSIPSRIRRGEPAPERILCASTPYPRDCRLRGNSDPSRSLTVLPRPTWLSWKLATDNPMSTQPHYCTHFSRVSKENRLFLRLTFYFFPHRKAFRVRPGETHLRALRSLSLRANRN